MVLCPPRLSLSLLCLASPQGRREHGEEWIWEGGGGDGEGKRRAASAEAAKGGRNLYAEQSRAKHGAAGWQWPMEVL